eukprot:scaffold236052_cov24-Attheya_sp.AAC.1
MDRSGMRSGVPASGIALFERIQARKIEFKNNFVEHNFPRRDLCELRISSSHSTIIVTITRSKEARRLTTHSRELERPDMRDYAISL